MDSQLIATLTHENLKAEIHSLSLPGEYKVVYQDDHGRTLEEAQLTGISSYKQREAEILGRLEQLSHGAKPEQTPDRGDPGEY